MLRSTQAEPNPAHRFITSPRAPAARGNADAREAAPVSPRLALNGLRNGQAPRAPRDAAGGESINARINDLFARVRQQERGLDVSPPKVTSCIAFPPRTDANGAMARVVRSPDNAVDCLVRLLDTPLAGRVAIINPADSRHRGGGLGVDTFRHQRMPAEETLCVLGRGAKASLDAATGYPLGPDKVGQRQLYSAGLQMRYDRAVLQALCDVSGTPGARLEAQRDLLLDASFATPSRNAPRYDMISIAALDRRDQPQIDAKALYTGMLRQFAHAMVNAKEHKVETFILALPGSGLFSRTSRRHDAPADPLYQHVLARAAVDAIRLFSRGLQRVVIPSHGKELDALIELYRKQPVRVPPPAAAAPAAPPRPGPRMPPVPAQRHAQPRAPFFRLSRPAQLPRSMGGLQYQVERENLSQQLHPAVARALQSLIGDGSKVTLRRVHGVPVPTQGRQPYWFLCRDPDPNAGRALVSVQVSPRQRQVFEVVFSRQALPQLASRVARAPAA